MKRLASLILLGTVAGFGCKKHYTPPAIAAANNYLVVEGIIAAGQDSTIIHLSRTVNVSTQSTGNPEISAVITVEGDQGLSYGLPETDSGKYAAAPLNLDNSHKYRIKIVTTDGQTYVSNYEPVKVTPPIDSFYYDTDDKGVNIKVKTHDPSNNTRFYRWDYSETYIYITPLHSYFVYQENPHSVDTLESVLRTPDQQINLCYINLNSSNILLNSTAALSKDVIPALRILEIPKESEKIFHRYSIRVNQYALTQDAYNFWANLRKNTQNIGTIFDPQPSQVATNIHCTSNPSLPVVGYVSVSTISHQRIFIDRTELPVWPYPPPSGCQTYGYCWFKPGQPPLEFTSGAVVPFGPIKNGACGDPPLPGYDVEVAQYQCADCRYHLGGKTRKPAFWQ